MSYQAKNYDRLLGTKGFSDALLKNHFTLYQGYVTNTNKLLDEFKKIEKTSPPSPQYAEMKRRFGWEWCGMRLHELYFDNMTKESMTFSADSSLGKKIAADFGSFEEWAKDFKATGAMRGIGWAMLYYDKEGDKLMNTWINEHDSGHLASCAPILIMDVFEHAFMLDYGLKRADYIEAFFNAICWKTAGARLKEASALTAVK